ncbi:MAG: metallophosphoesterase [Vicinamibacterales bacterium]
MKDTIRIAALGDLHYGHSGPSPVKGMLNRVAEHADLLVLCGDLTDQGTEAEARLLAKDLSPIGVPVIAVLGNHDVESGQERVVIEVLQAAGVHVLDGDAIEILGVGFAGVKGFAGGFGRGALGAWGEPAIKLFVQEAVNEALKLERALARLRTPRRIALLHYSPVRATVEGEPPEIFPYLGSSRLEEPLSRYPVDAIFHGHAHNGQLEGKTTIGTPVYNVSANLLARMSPHEPAPRIVEFARE